MLLRLPDRAASTAAAGGSFALAGWSSGTSRTSVMPHADRRERLRRNMMLPPCSAIYFPFVVPLAFCARVVPFLISTIHPDCNNGTSPPLHAGIAPDQGGQLCLQSRRHRPHRSPLRLCWPETLRELHERTHHFRLVRTSPTTPRPWNKRPRGSCS
jgi:hypothetical protein